MVEMVRSQVSSPLSSPNTSNKEKDLFFNFSLPSLNDDERAALKSWLKGSSSSSKEALLMGSQKFCSSPTSLSDHEHHSLFPVEENRWLSTMIIIVILCSIIIFICFVIYRHHPNYHTCPSFPYC